MTRLRIAAVSDLHGFLPDPDSLLGCDLVIVAGDICPIQDHSPAYQREWLERKFAPWLQAVSVPVVGCAGNHDIIFAPETKRSVPRLSWLYLEDEETELCGLRVYGTPWVPFLRPGWAFQAPETSGDDFLAQRFRAIPEGLDILISHGPPYGVQDTGPGACPRSWSTVSRRQSRTFARSTVATPPLWAPMVLDVAQASGSVELVRS